MIVGNDTYKYEIVTDWPQVPSEWAGWHWGWIVGVACDSQDRIFVYSRSERPLLVFDTAGNYLETWGEGILVPKQAHGLFIDSEDNVFCVDTSNHRIDKFDRTGAHLMTISSVGVEAGQPAAADGDPFNRPTDLAVAPNGDLFISDGYGNARVHKYSATGEHLLSWGERGDGPSQFSISHSVRMGKDGHVWICDRENNRVQIFDTDGNFLHEWTGLLRPNTIHFDPNDDVIYVAELGRQISLYTTDQALITQWGGAEQSYEVGGFIGGPHGLWTDSRGNIYAGEVELGDTGRMHVYVRV
ncbi:MAG: peptidyl-alpha-hydroxyglycine alpha-amidating lyase family protein [Chloroflexota bacterium]